ncbi:MAG TPA: glycosyltransferase family 4 protein [Acidimicrobiales bacterium]|nr:glycosyltransferase family 4 protein [Acidimicrobiales bacterium]
MAGTSERPLRVAFVTPRYGEGVVGGSEAVVAEAARGLAARGHVVELLTTCARSHFSWANEFEAGTFVEAGVTIRRFRTVRSRRRLLAAELERRVQRGERLDAAEEVAWVNARFRVPDLYLHLLGAARDLDAVVLSPYLFWSTIYGAQVVPDRSIVMPCLHDEPYARLAVVRQTLSSVGGVWFLSEPEHQLAHRLAPGLPPHHRVVGGAVEVPSGYDPAGFRRRHGIDRPFLLYAGRREAGKGWRDLLAGFAAALATGDLPFDLVTVGVGAAEVPDGLADRVVDLGYLDRAQLPHAFAAADALVQPSANESFSRTVMEAWLAGTPVIASAAGEVVTWHVERSGGGLTYRDDLELAECLRFVAQAPKAAAALAARGRAYVLANYTWDVVLDAMERSLRAFARRVRR